MINGGFSGGAKEEIKQAVGPQDRRKSSTWQGKGVAKGMSKGPGNAKGRKGPQDELKGKPKGGYRDAWGGGKSKGPCTRERQPKPGLYGLPAQPNGRKKKLPLVLLTGVFK